LYTFLIGIKGLSKAIEGISSPEHIYPGDQVQIKQGVIFNDEDSKVIIKKQWVEVISKPDSDGNFKFILRQVESENKILNGIANTKDKKKVASKWFLEAIGSPFICLFIGIFATVIFQSSSTTTSLIVAMAGGGIIGINSAVPMVMGANIGTTITNTIISMGHITKGAEFKRAFSAATVHDFFNLLAVIIFFPLELAFGIFQKLSTALTSLFFSGDFDVEFESPIKEAVKWGVSQFKDFLHIFNDSDLFLLAASGLLTLLMLFSIVKVLKNMVLTKVESFFDKYIFKTVYRSMAFGVILTVLVQSSSITTSTIVPLAGAGVLTLKQIFPFTLGANIGTTVTGLLAAMVLNPTAMIVAFSHLMFNILGILVIYPIRFLRNIPINAATKLAEIAIQNKFLPILYLIIVFILIPLFIIIAGG
tara:strand:- start:5373 stop:6629 length:1257 start_codon:yes stop_codon:yes gene_type:complete